jgi:hypothetical protein
MYDLIQRELADFICCPYTCELKAAQLITA